jgi:Zn-finger nucleic acid-binding protein
MADTAGTLHCLSCGAAVRSDATQCDHCGARLATVACPKCFGMIFKGSKFCPHCGTAVNRMEMGDSGLLCPRCENVPLGYVKLGTLEVAECAKCDGLWVENSAFEELCANREQQASILGAATQIPPLTVEMKVRYLKCPLCADLMNRHNFANCSGVVVDICKKHGTWFDAYELHRIMAFIQGGGIDRAREQQKRELDHARRMLEMERARGSAERQGSYSAWGPVVDSGTADVLGEVLWSLAKHLR